MSNTNRRMSRPTFAVDASVFELGPVAVHFAEEIYRLCGAETRIEGDRVISENVIAEYEIRVAELQRKMIGC